MTKSTQRSIQTLATLAIVGGGIYYAVQNKLLDKLFASMTSATGATSAGITPPAAPAATGDAASDNLLSQMFQELKDFKTSTFAYMAYLQGDYMPAIALLPANPINPPGPRQPM